jgi:hypothetical protein
VISRIPRYQDQGRGFISLLDVLRGMDNASALNPFQTVFIIRDGRVAILETPCRVGQQPKSLKNVIAEVRAMRLGDQTADLPCDLLRAGLDDVCDAVQIQPECSNVTNSTVSFSRGRL